jgi:hypothetical protein
LALNFTGVARHIRAGLFLSRIDELVGPNQKR